MFIPLWAQTLRLRQAHIVNIGINLGFRGVLGNK